MIDLACRDGGAWHRAVAALHGLAAAACAAWLLPAGPATAGSLAAGALAATWAWRRGGAPAPRLSWDGRTWRVDDQPAPAPYLVLDLGGWLLLHLGGGRWAPVSAAGAGAAWPALRAALYSPPPPLDRPAAGWRP